jgi:hypothetical protein
MSVPAVLSALFLIPDLLSARSHAHNFKQQSQQLGQDLQSGNLTNAQRAERHGITRLNRSGRSTAGCCRF